MTYHVRVKTKCKKCKHVFTTFAGMYNEPLRETCDDCDAEEYRKKIEPEAT